MLLFFVCCLFVVVIKSINQTIYLVQCKRGFKVTPTKRSDAQPLVEREK